MSVELRELLKEVKNIRLRVEKLENVIQERLLSEEEPSEDEKMAIREYEESKEKGRLELVPLREATKAVGIQRTNRKKGR